MYDYGAQRAVSGLDVKEQRYCQEFRHIEFETEHPVVRVHPETGEPSLLLGHFVRSFVALSTVDSADLFQPLHRIAIAAARARRSRRRQQRAPGWATLASTPRWRPPDVMLLGAPRLLSLIHI